MTPPASLRSLLAGAAFAFAVLPLAAAAQQQPASSTVTTPHVRAELVALAPQGVAPGQPLTLGLRIEHQPGWHTYWKNPGDSGLPTELGWTLPSGLDAGEIDWPVPHKLRIGSLVNYGYEGTLLLPVPVTVGQDFRPGGALVSGTAAVVDVKLHARWLVCSKECIPEEGDFALKLPVQGSTALDAAAFAAAEAARPWDLPDARSTVRVQDGQLAIQVDGLPAAVRGKALDVFPEVAEVIDNDAAHGLRWQQAWKDARWTGSIPLSPSLGARPESIPLVFKLQDGATAWRTVAAVEGDWPAVRAAATVSPALQAALAANASAATPPPAATPLGAGALLAALAAALLGGLLLNLMPCVLPVLAIKVLGIARHGGDRRAQRIAGLAYTVGVVASFLALGGLMLGLRAAGAQVGWGFQLQSPAVVAALAALFTLIGLNLAGVFQFGQFAPAGLAGAQARHPAVDALLSGVLAVAVASPCTAPFMGASLGFAIGLPAAQALAIFGALGLGLALPFLAAALVPASARLLPRPGAWMETFRQVMAFPMFATVAWLVWVLGQQVGIDGAGALLALLVALAAVAWAFALRGRARLVVGTLAVASFALLAALLGEQVLRPQTTAQSVAAAGGQAEGDWQPWSAARVAELTAAGRPVFVDFTAAWCVTCQYNKKTTLSDPTLLADLRARNVALLRADWTRADPAITATLRTLGRSGVPVYAVYAPGRAPVVLSEVIAAGDVRAAFAGL